MQNLYKASHILLSDLEDAQYVLEKLEKGLSFEDLAREFSECDSAQKSGSLGVFSSGTMDAAFERALYHMKPGEVSSPIATKYGFHIIKKFSI